MTNPRLWSVWQLMQAFSAWQLAKVFHLIECARRDGIPFEINAGRRDEQITKEFVKDWVDDIVVDARELMEKVELESVDGRVSEYGGLTIALEQGLTYQELDHELKFLRECFQIDLSKKLVYSISKNKQEYLNKKHILDLWGLPGFYFPSIRKDATDALRAYAFDLNTACVFHLMRVTEIGLRALARRMKVTLPRKRQLEWAQWQDIIKAMSDKTDKLFLNKRAGKAKDEMLEFYRGAIGEFQGFKDAYRNFVMHMREKNDYKDPEVHTLILRVSDFMRRLAGKIDEQGHALTKARINRIFAKLEEDTKAAEKEKQDEQGKQGISELRSDNARTAEGSA